jgi:hypothetical protein
MTLWLSVLVACVLNGAPSESEASNSGSARREFERALAEPDAAKRAEAIVLFLDRGDPSLHVEVHRAWENCGKAALPVLYSLVADESRTDRDSLLGTLVRAGGKDCVPNLVRLLKDECVYWNNLGMNLDEESKIPQSRVQFLVDLLTHLNVFAYRDNQGLVRGVRDRFRDHPLLCNYGKRTEAGAPVGASPVVQTAGAILARP